MKSFIYGIGGGGGSATPAGNSGELQFNDGGTPAALAADDHLYWDNATTNKRLGIQVGTTPQNPLHVDGQVALTQTAVSVGSCTRTAESIAGPPGASTSLVAQADLSGPTPTPTQDVGAYNFVANGQAFDYTITPYLTALGVKYQGVESIAGSYTDTINDATTTFRNTISWSAVSGASGYLLKRQINGGGYTTSIDVGNVTSYNDNDSSDSDTLTAWPNVYISNESASSSPASFDSASQNLSGTQYIANGQTIDYAVDSYITIAGTKYVSGTPVTISFTDVINDATTPFSVDLNWSSGGSQSGFILRKSFDAGSTWTYLDVGNITSYTDDNYADDGSGTVWANPFSGFTGTPFTFRVYGITSSPNAYPGGVYSSTYTQYTATIPNDNVARIILHSFTSIPAVGFKVLGVSTSSYNKGIVKTTDFYDPDYTSWTDGATVTPNHYGFTGTDIDRIYRIYSYKTLSGIRIYSSTYLQVSMSNPGSGYYYAALSWTIPSGADGVRILRSINGGAYNAGKDFTSPTASGNDEATGDQWSGANTTVTPNSLEQVPARFDRESSTSNLLPQLLLVSTAASNAVSKIAFCTAADSASDSTTRAGITCDSDYALYLESTHGSKAIYLGTYGSPYARFRTDEILFNAQLQDTDFRVVGISGNPTLMVDTGIDTTLFGSAAGSFSTSPDAAVAIRPYRDADDNLILERRGAQTGWLLRTRNSSGSTFGGFNDVGYLVLPTTGSTSTPNLVVGTSGFSIQSTNISTIISGTSVCQATSSGLSITKKTSTGAFATGYTAKTANYTLTVDDYCVNCTSGSFDITLPTAVGVSGQIYVVKNSGSGTITMKTTSSQTMDGFSSAGLTLAQYDSYTFMSDGANWIIL